MKNPKMPERIVRSSKGNKKLRVHLADTTEGGRLRPVCGGGCGARTSQWQVVLVQVDCQACAKILRGASPAAANEEQKGKEPNES